MSELNFSSNLEAEIAELSKQIEAKKLELEQQSGIVPEGKEIVAEALAEHFVPASPVTAPADDAAAPTSSPAPLSSRPQVPVSDYLDTLEPETVSLLNSYISMVPTEGFKKTIAKVKTENPFIVDAFHDILITRLYEELKTRGIVK